MSLKGIDTVTVGIILHNKDGEVSVSKTNTWVNYTTPHFRKELSIAIVFDPKYYAGHTIHKSHVRDESHVFVHLKISENMVIYYAEFNWSESKQFANKQDWENDVSQVSRGIPNPL